MLKLDKSLHWLGLLACAALTAFIVLTQFFGRFPSQIQYATSLMLATVAIATLRRSSFEQGSRPIGQLLVAIGVVVASVLTWIYFSSEYDEIANFREGLPNTLDLWCYAIGTLLVIWAAHRAEGWLLTAVVLTAVGYLAFGHLLPGIFEHRPFSPSRILEKFHIATAAFLAWPWRRSSILLLLSSFWEQRSGLPVPANFSMIWH